MIILNESNDWSGYLVRFTYQGDSLSDYETTLIVKSNNKSDAIDKAKKYVKKITNYPPYKNYDNARNFRIDGKIDSYEDYKKKYKNSNFDVVE